MPALSWDEQRARDRQGAYYSKEQALAQKLGEARKQIERQQAETEDEASGELDALALDIQAMKVNLKPDQWQALVESGDVTGVQPREWDQPLVVRNRAAEMRLAEVFRKRTAEGQ